MLALAVLGLFVAGTLGASVPKRRQLNDCNFACTDEYAPVCATNHQTYSNACEFKRAECIYGMSGSPLALRIVHDGPCEGVVAGSSVGSVGSGVAYPVDVGAPVDPAIGVLPVDPAIGVPVDPAIGGVVYPAIGAPSDCSQQICDEEIRHVCASDGTVYQNPCLFQRAQCEAALNHQQLTIVSYSDTCPQPRAPECDKYHVDTSDLAIEGGAQVSHLCPSTYQYVCASDGRSYSSECQLCQHMETAGDTTLMIQHDGTCQGHLGIPIDVIDPYWGHIIG